MAGSTLQFIEIYSRKSMKLKRFSTVIRAGRAIPAPVPDVFCELYPYENSCFWQVHLRYSFNIITIMKIYIS